MHDRLTGSSLADTAVILAGGVSSFGAGRPTLLLPIANRPLVEYLAAVLRASGIQRLIISTDSRSARTTEDLAKYARRSPFHVEWVAQRAPRGTAGSLKELEGRLTGGAFWVVSGDLLLGTDLRRMLTFHRERGAAVTVGACRVHEPAWEMERIEVTTGSRVKGVHRIHPAENRRSTLRPAGVYLFEPAVLDLIPRTGYFDLKEQLLPRLAEYAAHAIAWEVPGYCRTIVSVADYMAANRDILLGRVRFRDMERRLSPEAPAVRSRIAPSATLLPPVVIDPAVCIGERAMVIGPTAIGQNCEIGAGAILNECIVLSNASIGQGARLDRCVVAEGAVVEDGAVLRGAIVRSEPMDVRDMAPVPGAFLPLAVSGLMPAPDSRPRARRPSLLCRRAFDTVVAAIGLIGFAPLMALIALAIRLDSPGPIIFRQRRSGQRGREFTMYKLRTMVTNAEELKAALLPRNQVDGPMFKIIDDPRITRVGRVLRATNLDELPQLWNVLRGEMNLVGPRPLSMEEMRYNPRWRDIRLLVRPGLTGLWQVEEHTKLSFADWIRCDLTYVSHPSFWLDLRILFRTILNVWNARGDGADGSRDRSREGARTECPAAALGRRPLARGKAPAADEQRPHVSAREGAPQATGRPPLRPAQPEARHCAAQL